jgi:hypothetical protein
MSDAAPAQASPVPSPKMCALCRTVDEAKMKLKKMKRRLAAFCDLHEELKDAMQCLKKFH